MVDDLRSDDGLGGLESHYPRQTRRAESQRPLADREVPLAHQEQDGRVLAAAVHAWLDGEMPEASLRKGETAHDVEFWKNVSVEVERRRRTRTPAYLEAQIMESLPQTAPQLITPWWRREFVITPGKAVAAAASLVVGGAAIAAAIMAALH